MTRLLRLWLLAGAAIGCSSDFMSPQFHTFQYSAAAGGCGAAGGPVVVIYLAPKPVVQINQSPPIVWVVVPVGPSELTAHAWPIGSNEETAAWFKADTSTSAIAGSGSLTVNSVAGDNSIDGSLSLQFSTAGSIKTDFHANWLADTFYCI